jgi:small subunit ribosomal protein S6e
MARFKVILSDPEARTSKAVEVEGARAAPLIGKRIGETIDGSVVGLSGHKLQITGGSDKDGFPMRPNIHGGVRVRAILSGGVGFHSKQEGERRRKTLRGNVITEEIVQINMKIIEKPRKTEKPKEAKKEGRKQKEEKAITEEVTAAKAKPVKPGGKSSEKTAQAARS